jgi:hypothetical protein
MTSNPSASVRKVLINHGLTTTIRDARHTYHDTYHTKTGLRHRVKVVIKDLPTDVAKRGQIEAELQQLFGDKFVGGRWSFARKYYGINDTNIGQCTVRFDE